MPWLIMKSTLAIAILFQFEIDVYVDYDDNFLDRPVLKVCRYLIGCFIAVIIQDSTMSHWLKTV